ncbi:MAG TPA: sigma-70 family RNA polymerase sigma factor [Vicinamibacterales bacterium]
MTQLLQEWRRGDDSAVARLFPLVYEELRRLAAASFRRERPGHVLQPTALVHEAFIRLVGQKHARVDGRAHFLSLAAQAMRRILVDDARRRRSVKRGSGEAGVPLDEAVSVSGHDVEPDVLDLHRALEELAAVNDRQAGLVELRYFGGLTMEEAAEVLGVSLATAERDWTAARLWLRRRLDAPPGTKPQAKRTDNPQARCASHVRAPNANGSCSSCSPARWRSRPAHAPRS